MESSASLTGVERNVGDDEIIVTKTDLRGAITYSNEVFERIGGYTKRELRGSAHSIVRHPDMPRCVFRLLWRSIEAGREIFAYVINRSKNGDHYWVLAHVTPTFDDDDRITGYHSNRRRPDRAAVDAIAPLYARLVAEERRHDSKEAAIAASTKLLESLLAERGLTYDEFVFSLVERESASARAPGDRR